MENKLKQVDTGRNVRVNILKICEEIMIVAILDTMQSFLPVGVHCQVNTLLCIIPRVGRYVALSGNVDKNIVIEH